MCLTPNLLDNGIEVGCRQCWQCRKRKVDDLVGRCIAESKFATKTIAATLTYDNSNGARSVTLVYKDVQSFLKNLRKKYKCRFLVVGEHGSFKNRAHWHIALFFTGKYPNVKNETRLNWQYWTKGFTYFQEPHYEGFRYILKYILKEPESNRHKHLSMSLKPALGDEYFNRLVDKYVESGIEPKSWKYRFPEIKDRNGKIRKFSMQGHTRGKFCYLTQVRWHQKWGKEIQCDLFDEFLMNETMIIDDRRLIKNEDGELKRVGNWEPTKEEISRIHDKPVKYFSDPKFPHVEISENHWTNGNWFKMTYRGIPLYVYEHFNERNIYTEAGEWLNVPDEIMAQIGKRGRILSKGKYADFFRQKLN